MARLIILLAALFMALPATADQHKDGQGKRRGEEMKASRADCEKQANKRDLIGKERKRFMKECAKGDKQGKHRGEREDGDDRRQGREKATGAAPAPSAQPTAPASAAPATSTPAPAPTAAPAPPK